MTKLRIVVSTGGVALKRDSHNLRAGNHGPPNVVATVLSQQVQYKTAQATLTAREIEVLKFVAAGLTNGQTALQMKVSIKTVEKHRQSLMNKLNLHHTAGLAGYAFRNNLLFETQVNEQSRQSAMGPSPDPPKEVTPREKAVLKLLAEGLVNKQIAWELNISIKTVEHHRLDLMKRLGIHHVAGLTRYALSKGLIDLNRLISGAKSQPQAYLQH